MSALEKVERADRMVRRVIDAVNARVREMETLHGLKCVSPPDQIEAMAREFVASLPVRVAE